MNGHLTNEQLFDLLDSASPAGKAHLATCNRCREEFETLSLSLANFRLAATAFARRHGPVDASARPLVKGRQTSSFFRFPLVWIAGLVTAAALCTAGLSLNHRPSAPAPAVATNLPAVPAQTAPKSSSADEDAALLEGIDRDLSTSIPPSLAPLDVTSASDTTSTRN